MKKPLILHPTHFLRFLNGLGLDLTEKTGGRFIENAHIEGYSRSEQGFLSLKMKDTDPILFMTDGMFLKTVKRTEESLQVKLFR